MTENIDNEYLDEKVICNSILQGEENKHNEIIFKALSEPLRRKLIMLIGPLGKSFSLIKKEMRIEESLLNFHINYLTQNGFLVIADNKYKLNEKGILLLSRI